MLPVKLSWSTVFKFEVVNQVGTDKRPEFTRARAKGNSLASSNTALRKVLLVVLFGVMKSVERVEFMMFSSAAKQRSWL